MAVTRTLTDREEKARLNLSAIFQREKLKRDLTQAEVNKALSWSPSVFGQYLSGRMPLSPRACAKLSDFFHCYPSDIDPQLSSEFATSPESSIPVLQQLERLDDAEIRRLVFDLSRQLPKKDVGLLIQILTDRLLSD